MKGNHIKKVLISAATIAACSILRRFRSMRMIHTATMSGLTGQWPMWWRQ